MTNNFVSYEREKFWAISVLEFFANQFFLYFFLIIGYEFIFR